MSETTNRGERLGRRGDPEHERRRRGRRQHGGLPRHDPLRPGGPRRRRRRLPQARERRLAGRGVGFGAALLLAGALSAWAFAHGGGGAGAVFGTVLQIGPLLAAASAALLPPLLSCFVCLPSPPSCSVLNVGLAAPEETVVMKVLGSSETSGMCLYSRIRRDTVPYVALSRSLSMHAELRFKKKVSKTSMHAEEYAAGRFKHKKKSSWQQLGGQLV
jgi:hypothetical protein